MGLFANIFGKNQEKKAENFLVQQGFEILATNYHCKFGEIDIIAQKNEVLHFIEVKATSKDYEPILRITKQKLEKIIKTINFYLYKNNTEKAYQIDACIIKKDKVELIENISF